MKCIKRKKASAGSLWRERADSLIWNIVIPFAVKGVRGRILL